MAKIITTTVRFRYAVDDRDADRVATLDDADAASPDHRRVGDAVDAFDVLEHRVEEVP